jgi:hypothetical protein
MLEHRRLDLRDAFGNPMTQRPMPTCAAEYLTRSRNA